MTKLFLWILTILSFCLMIFGFFYIPILTACGVEFPARNFLWALTILPTVVVFSLPFVFCVNALIKKKKSADATKNINKK